MFFLQRKVGQRRASDPPQPKASCGSKVACALGLILVVFVCASLGLAVGLFVGHSIGKGSSSSADCPTQAPSTTGPPPPPSNQSRQFNWGDMAKGSDGQLFDVLDFFDKEMTKDNIKNNLK